MLYVLTWLELFLSAYWLINGMTLYNVKTINERCKYCFFNSLFSIFIQNFEWAFFTCSLHNLMCFMDESKELKFKQRFKIYLIISLAMALGFTYTVFFTGIYGISVINYLFNYIIYILAYVNLLHQK
jgi:hypothetical protein